MNVLFISIDDLRTEIGAYGATRAITPNIDKLAARGVKFERAYTQYPLCNPSRASLLTGRYPVTNELYGNRDWFGAFDPSLVSLPKYFKQHGYTTIRSGKIFHGDTIDDAAAWTIGGVPHKFNAPKPASSVAATPITEEEEAKRIGRMIEADVRQAPGSDRWVAVEDPDELAKLGDTRATDRAIEYLKQWKKGDAPLFLGFGLSKPHSPLIAPKEFFDNYDLAKIELPVDFADKPTVPAGFPKGSIRAINADLFIRRLAPEDEAKQMIRAYLACVSYMDANVGRVLEALENSELRDNTIIVFWSDHGYQLGEKGKWSKAGSLWEQGTRVPLIIYDPRAKGNGQASPRVVELLDLYPTLTALAGLPQPAGLDGHDLTPLLAKPDAKWGHPAYTVWNERSRGVSGVVVRTEKWRYAEFFGPGAGAFLTDPINDPHELKNLVADPQHAAVIAELSKLARTHVAGKTEPTP
ncbi:sulfatase [Oleiharenicola lentus]|uniref:sulfatase n=1 Tax=Oleiharenicola lentus TaxID=2508720 RepID=UPI003F6616EF